MFRETFVSMFNSRKIKMLSFLYAPCFPNEHQFYWKVPRLHLFILLLRLALMMKMSMEQWWNFTDRGKLKFWEKNIIECGW